MEKIKNYANNFYQDSMMLYHEDYQCTDMKKAEGYLRPITDPNLFVTNESKIYILGTFKKIYNSSHKSYLPHQPESPKRNRPTLANGNYTTLVSCELLLNIITNLTGEV
jgi:hypothetical protein